jgi:amidase
MTCRMSDTAFRSAVDLVAAIARREIGSRELLEHHAARVERLNPRINAVVTLDLERARRRADAADRAVARGEALGPLHGLPMTIKDVMETAGIRTTSGAEIYTDHVPAADAAAVARLVRAGAIVFGKTNTPTLAMDCQTYNTLFGTTNNPWDTSRVPGGSSGGAAAALVAGLTPLELGTDIGGSIRNPAHYCGVYGHKPTFGIVPMQGYIPPPPGTLADTDLNVIGPLARSAEDLALALDVLAGPDDDRAIAWRLALPPPRRTELRDYRVAAWLDDPACPTDGEVGARLQTAVDGLAAAGARVDDRARPAFGLREAYRDYYQLLCLATCNIFGDDQFASLVRFADGLPDDADDLMARYSRAGTRRHRDWLALNEARERYRQLWAEVFRKHDVLLCPVTPVAAIPHDHDPNWAARTIRVNGEPRPYEDQLVWAGIVGMAYLPATVAPVGRTAAGLPVGIQIVGPYLEDRTPIDFARRLADVVGGFEIPPGFEE